MARFFDCRLTDVEGAGDAALCLTGRKPLLRLAPLMGGEFRLAPEFDALRLRVGEPRAVRSTL